MEKRCGFLIDDATGCPSAGRLLSLLCFGSATLFGILGKHDLVGTFLTAAFSFYFGAKAQQAVTNVFGK